MATSRCTLAWFQERVLLGYQSDPHALELLAKLAVNEKAVPNFTLKEGLLRCNEKVWIGNNSYLQSKIIAALHDTAIGGHSGVPVTYQKIKQLFGWPAMKSMVHEFVKSCVTCPKAKPDCSKYPGLLQPLSIPQGAWQTISMDFIEGLLTSGSAN